jgi:hypothetical protein
MDNQFNTILPSTPVSQAVSSVQAFRRKCCKHLWTPFVLQCMFSPTHPTWSNHRNYVIFGKQRTLCSSSFSFGILPLLPVCCIQIFSSESSPQIPSVCIHLEWEPSSRPIETIGRTTAVWDRGKGD